MAYQITIPRLDWSMDEGVFVEWLKKDGETINEGDPLFSLETEKSVQDIESIDSGLLCIPSGAPAEGETVPVGAVIGYLVASGEEPPEKIEATESEATTTIATAQEKVGSVSPMSVKSRSGSLPNISPRAARIAAELNVDWSELQGSGSTGRIREQDIRAAASANQSNGDASCGEERLIPHSQIRKTIAQRMSASSQATAPVTLTTTADATNLVALRKQFKTVSQKGAHAEENNPEKNKTAPGYTDFVIKLAAAALLEHPMLNSRWSEEGIRVSSSVNLGFAVDTEAGLIVPVVHNADKLSLREIANCSTDLVARAQVRRLKKEETQGGTFTVTNLGGYNIDAFTPIINHPQCAILGLGRIQKQPVVEGDTIVVRDIITLSLTFDHRVVDGAPAAKFLDSVRGKIENPAPWLMP